MDYFEKDGSPTPSWPEYAINRVGVSGEPVRKAENVVELGR